MGPRTYLWVPEPTYGSQQRILRPFNPILGLFLKFLGPSRRVLKAGGVPWGSWGGDLWVLGGTYGSQQWILRPFNLILGSFMKISGPSTRVLKAGGFLGRPGMGTYGSWEVLMGPRTYLWVPAVDFETI